MSDPSTHTHFINPWVLHLQKLGLELKCSLCLKVYNKPMLLPCNHIFCSSCVPKLNTLGLDCPLCKLPYVEQDLRFAPFVENVVNIYKSMKASVSAHMLNSDLGRGKSKYPNQVAKNHADSSTPGNSTSGTCGNLELHEAVDVDMNQMESSPDSPPSSGGSKGVDVESRDPRSIHDTAGKCLSNKSAKRTTGSIGAQGQSHDQFWKKQKQHGLSQICQGSATSLAVNLQTAASTVSDMTNTGNNSAKQGVECDSAGLANFVCAFCQTWKITEGSGPMQHFANGREVFGNEAGRSHVMHVHESCIDWAPQIYYENDTTMKNLDKELARAGKLKCTCCGLKGAALGCFAKSCRRSYHVPCAYEVPGCRWDMDDFLMLCPVHASQKFPKEKFKKPDVKKCSSAKINIEQKSLCDFDFWASSPRGAKDWVLCGSALSVDEKYKLVKFAKLCGATVTKAWNPDVTHVIAATDANGACSRTLKVLMAILNGRWVLNIDWIESCMQLQCPVDETAHEIVLDNHGCCDGPKTGRLRVLNNAPKLFSGLTFFFVVGFVETYKKDLENLIIAAGGTILESEAQLQQSNSISSHPSSTTILVYNDDTTGEDDDALQQQLEVEKLTMKNGSQVIPHTWILDSIASGALQPYVQS